MIFPSVSLRVSDRDSPNRPICASEDVTPGDDIVEVGIEETLTERGALELCGARRRAARWRLEGPIAALLRW
jgi:hypothetical protein